MRERAKEQFNRRLAVWHSWCERQRIPEPSLLVRYMPKRWGSAHKNGRIALNPQLVRAPSLCIDYVIAHEICHLKYPNHGAGFFRLLDAIFPNWRTAKDRLEQSDL